MTCPRCEGLLVHEYLLDHREGPLSGFQGLRCVNCGAIHDEVIHMNQLVSPSLTRVRSPVAWLAFASRRIQSLARSQQSDGQREASHGEKTHCGCR